MNENEYENESSDDEQSQQTMAASYANVVQAYLSRNSKPGSTITPIVMYISMGVTHMSFVTLTLPKNVLVL
jgi:predicted transcriptional regulator